MIRDKPRDNSNAAAYNGIIVELYRYNATEKIASVFMGEWSQVADELNDEKIRNHRSNS